MTFENGVNNNYNNNNNHTRSRKKINLQSIDTIPEEPNTISGGKNMGDSTSIQTVLLYTTISGGLFYCFFLCIACWVFYDLICVFYMFEILVADEFTIVDN